MSRFLDDDELQELTPEERDILQRLGTLPREAELPRDLWTGVAARIGADRPARLAPPRRQRRLGRLLIQAAAALLIFAAGFLAGQLRHSESVPGPVVTARRAPLAAAIEVQRTGTEYVTALAALRSQNDPASRAQGREAALSTLYGAAHELTRLSPEDARARQILNTVSTTRSAAREPGPTRIVRF